MTTRVSEYQYDIEVKGQGQIFLKSVLSLVTRIFPKMLMMFIKIAYGTYVNFNECFRSYMTKSQRSRSNTLKLFHTARNMNSAFIP